MENIQIEVFTYDNGKTFGYNISFEINCNKIQIRKSGNIIRFTSWYYEFAFNIKNNYKIMNECSSIGIRYVCEVFKKNYHNKIQGTKEFINVINSIDKFFLNENLYPKFLKYSIKNESLLDDLESENINTEIRNRVLKSIEDNNKKFTNIIMYNRVPYM